MAARKKATATGKVRALRDLMLRQSPDHASPLHDEWHVWPAGTEFEPPPHMDVAKAIASGKVEVVA